MCEIESPEGRFRKEHLVQRGNIGHRSGKVPREFLADMLCVSRIGYEDLGVAEEQRAHAIKQPGKMEERETGDIDLTATLRIEPLLALQQVAYYVSMGQFGPLWHTGCPTSILDEAIVPETRMPRGTKKKVALAGMVSFMFAVFLAFGREYFAKIKEAEQRRELLYDVDQHDAKESGLVEFKNKRKIIGSQRRKLTQKIKSYL